MNKLECSSPNNTTTNNELLEKAFRYVEIEYNLYIEFKFKSRYLRWLRNSRNDNYLDRLFSHNGEYGSFNIEIFCIRNGSKEKIDDKKITKVLGKYGKIGYEIIGIRTFEDKGEFHDKSYYFYQQITYTLKEEYLISIEEESDKYIIIEENQISEKVEKENLEIEESEDSSVEEDDPFASEPIEKLELSVRPHNLLKRAQINFISDLLDYTQEDLLEIKNFRRDNANETIQKLQEKFGITLPSEHDKSALS